MELFWLLVLASLGGISLPGIAAILLLMLVIRLMGGLVDVIFYFIAWIWYHVPEWLKIILIVAGVVIIIYKIYTFR